MSKPDDELETFARSFLRLVGPNTEDGRRLAELVNSNSIAAEGILPLLGSSTQIAVTVHPVAANCTGPDSLHSHTYFELVYVFRGSCLQYFEGGAVRMQEGSFCLLNTQARHGVSVGSSEDLVFNVIIPREIFDHVLVSMIPSDSVLMSFFLESTFSSSAESDHLIFEPREGSQARYFIRALILEYYHERPGYLQAMSSNLSLLLIELMRTSIYQAERNDEGKDVKLVPVLSYIQAHLADVTLEDLARRFGYSSGYLSRTIKRFTGRPFKEMVGEMRLARAAERLSWTSESVEQIGQELGYYDRSHFNRAFRKRYGMSPSEYRSQAR